MRKTGLFVNISLVLAIARSMMARLFWRMADPPPEPEKTLY
jgi:hypothetical protein